MFLPLYKVIINAPVLFQPSVYHLNTGVVWSLSADKLTPYFWALNMVLKTRLICSIYLLLLHLIHDNVLFYAMVNCFFYFFSLFSNKRVPELYKHSLLVWAYMRIMCYLFLHFSVFPCSGFEPQSCGSGFTMASICRQEVSGSTSVLWRDERRWRSVLCCDGHQCS